jgi:hypothetical protein
MQTELSQLVLDLLLLENPSDSFRSLRIFIIDLFRGLALRYHPALGGKIVLRDQGSIAAGAKRGSSEYLLRLNPQVFAALA